MNANETGRPGFCIYVDTVFQGPIPIQHDEAGYPVAYSTLHEAQRDIVEDAIERLTQFLEGTRDFESAITIDEYVLEVDVFPDGTIVDESGNRFGRMI